jgi:Flp pilus assembly protein TadB
MVKEITRLNIIMAGNFAQHLGLHKTSERLQRLPEKISRFKQITDPDRRLIQARWLSLDAEFTEKTFKEDMKDKQKQIDEVGGMCSETSNGIKNRSRGILLVDLAFVAMGAYCIATGAVTAGTAIGLLIAAAVLNLSFFATAMRIKTQAKLLKEGPKLIEEGIKELKEDLCAITGEN